MYVEIGIANGIDIFIYIYLSDILIYHKFAIIKKCELIEVIKDIEKIIKYKKYRTLKHYKTLKLNRS